MRKSKAAAWIVIWLSVYLWPQTGTQPTKPAKNPGSATVQHSSGRSKSVGSVDGRVFAITRTGDLKPARLARVYLIRGLDLPPENAVSVFLEKHTSGLEDLKNYADDSEELTCKRELLAVDDAILASIQWVDDNKKHSQILSVQTDEDGTFLISGIVPGYYMLAARGQAGANDAYWTADIQFFQSGDKGFWREGAGVQETSTLNIKLGSPERACLSIN
jgi:hypothetical protein